MSKFLSFFLRNISKELSKFHDTANQDAKSIFCDVLNVDTTYLYINRDTELSDSQIQDIQVKVSRYKNGEPLAHILGYKFFWDQKLLVNQHTLIPRADTEILIESVLADYPDTGAKLRILDLGTGTGAIALALAGEYKNSEVIAVDYSVDALDVAKQNVQLNDISNVNFIQSDWYQSLDNQLFDIIVSNPPYIDENDEEMEFSVAKYEPKTALVATENGLADIRIIVSESYKYLKDGGSIYIEHGYKQGNSVRDVLSKHGFRDVETFKDFCDKDRISKGLYSAKSI